MRENIAYSIQKLSEVMQPIKKGGRRMTVQFKDDLDLMAELKAKNKKAKTAKK
jgi:hypothetical protein